MLALLVHSPLVGPSTLQSLAEQLEPFGWTTVVPDLRSAIGSPHQFVAVAVDSTMGSADLVVGHSGAGAFLPLIAQETDSRATLFIDAVLPYAAGPFRPSKDFMALLERLDVTDGLLPPWNDWWTPEVMARLVPDDALRRRLVEEIGRVPRSFYDASIALPPGWHTRPAGYLQLSAAYEAEATRAEQWGWPVARLDGQHLDVTVRSGLVARHTNDLARVLVSAPGSKPSAVE